MYYVARGSIPRQRHTQHRAPDGSLYAEELFGVDRPEWRLDSAQRATATAAAARESLRASRRYSRGLSSPTRKT